MKSAIIMLGLGVGGLPTSKVTTRWSQVKGFAIAVHRPCQAEFATEHLNGPGRYNLLEQTLFTLTYIFRGTLLSGWRTTQRRWRWWVVGRQRYND